MNVQMKKKLRTLIVLFLALVMTLGLAPAGVDVLIYGDADLESAYETSVPEHEVQPYAPNNDDSENESQQKSDYYLIEDSVITNFLTFSFPEDISTEYGEQPILFIDAGNEYDLLYDVIAVTETGQNVDVQISDDGGFYIYAEFPDNVFTVTYSAVHPESNEEFTRERTVVVVVPIMPLSIQVFTWEELRAEVIAAGTVPTTIYLMTPEILTGVGVAGQSHGGGANSILIAVGQEITLINGQPGADSRVNLVRNLSNTAAPMSAANDTSDWGHVNNRRSHELFTVEGTLHLGMANPPTPQANNITLGNLVRRVNWATSLWGHNDPIWGTNTAGGQMRGGVRVRGANAHLHMYNGVVIEYGRHEDEGGNMRITHGGTFTMHGGTIRRGFGDATGGAGAAGGVFVAGINSHFIMHNGIIEENELSNNVTGGGVAIAGGATFTMNGGIIRNHILFGQSRGGGVSVGFFNGTTAGAWGGSVNNFHFSGTFNMHGGVIEGGQATFHGGGVLVNTQAYFNMTAGTIRYNRAGVAADGTFVSTTANGGGVFTLRPNLSNINIGNVQGNDTSSQVHFYGNRSSAHGGSPLLLNMGVEDARNHPILTNIRWLNWQLAHNTGTTSVGIGPGEAPLHLINNWDVNVTTQTPYTILRIITMANGGTNTSMVSNDPILPINTTGTNLFLLTGGNGTFNAGTRSGYAFSHWTTTNTATGESINIPGLTGSTNPTTNLTNMPAFNVTATANWVYGMLAPIYRTVTFNSRLGSAVAPQIIQDGQPATRPTSPTRTGYTFGGWFATDAMATGTGGTEFNFNSPTTENITLFARWTADVPPPSPPPAPAPASAPTPTPPPPPVDDVDEEDDDVVPIAPPAIDTPDVEALPYTPVDVQPEDYYQLDYIEVPLAVELPLVAPNRAVWAVANLVLAIIGIALVALVALRIFLFRRHDVYSDEHNTKHSHNKHHLSWLIITGIVAIIGIILFFMTQDMSNSMVPIDFWTIAHVIFVAIEVVALVRVVKHNNDKDGFDDEMVAQV